jgi:hypothetical protein
MQAEQGSNFLKNARNGCRVMMFEFAGISTSIRRQSSPRINPVTQCVSWCFTPRISLPWGFAAILNDARVDMVVEVMGGLTDAKDVVFGAISK